MHFRMTGSGEVACHRAKVGNWSNASNIEITYRRPDIAKVLSMAAQINLGKMFGLGAGPENLTSCIFTEVTNVKKRIIIDQIGEVFLHVELRSVI